MYISAVVALLWSEELKQLFYGRRAETALLGIYKQQQLFWGQKRINSSSMDKRASTAFIYADEHQEFFYG